LFNPTLHTSDVAVREVPLKGHADEKGANARKDADYNCLEISKIEIVRHGLRNTPSAFSSSRQ